MVFSYLVLLVFPLSTVAMLNYWKSADVIEEKSISQFHNVSLLANQQFDQYFRDIETLSFNIMESPIIQSRLKQRYVQPNDWTTAQIEQEEKVRQFLGSIYKMKQGIDSIVLYENNGIDDYYQPIRTVWNNRIQAKNEKWYKRAVEAEGRWILTGLREDAQLLSTVEPAPKQVVTFSRVLKDENTFEPLGVLAIHIDIATLQELAVIKDSGTRLTILDETGIPVVSSANFTGDETGGNWLKVSAKSEITGWNSVTMVSKDELFVESRNIRDSIIGMTVVLIFASLITANFIASGIVKPLQRLKKRMKGVEQGELYALSGPFPKDEFGDLSSHFNQMVQRIRSLLDEVRVQEQQKLQIELSALQARINPHFMYNTLNGIRWAAMSEGNQRVAELIASFVYLLQFSARNNAPLIQIAEEEHLLIHYIELMKMRNDQFDYEISIDQEVKTSLIIPYLLQPIVENAIFHGIVPLKSRGKLTIRLFKEPGRVYVNVEDNGIGMNESQIVSIYASFAVNEGIGHVKMGIGNVYDRLKLRYEGKADLKVRSVQGQGTMVEISWPCDQAADRRQREC
jgi:two-component system sensor histidine kinase YesM